jgi:hypothetical protein
MERKKTLWLPLAAALLALAAVVWAWLHFHPRPGPAPLKPVAIPRFAPYPLVKSQVVPRLPEYQLIPAELPNLPDMEKAWNAPFSPAQLAALEQHHFLATENRDRFYDDNPQEIANRSDDWTYLYELMGGPYLPQGRRPENAVFITADFLLHVYHRLLAKELEYLEQKVFYPKLDKITDTLLESALKAHGQAGSREQKESWRRLIVYLAVPSAIIDGAYDYYHQERIDDEQPDSTDFVFKQLEKFQDRLPGDCYSLARQELALVLDADQVAPSPFLGKYQAEAGLNLLEDYTQYQPRSHYAKNPVLRAYFRAMVWYGRVNFLLQSPQLTRDAVNLTLLLDKAGLMKDWEDIYLPTVFLVGESDDLGPYEYRQALAELRYHGPQEPGDALISQVQGLLKDYKKPRVMSSAAYGDRVFALSKEQLQAGTQGFRLMGQRVTPDAFIFSALTQGDEKPDPETGEKLPGQTTALLVMSLLGSKTAAPLAAEWIAREAPGSRRVMARRLEQLGGFFQDLPLETWTQNIYWAWLFNLKALFQEGRDLTGYPMFMRSPEWPRKNLQCALGSWTELKHDTLLYAKQSYAEQGNGAEEEEIPPVPKGYVEPNAEFLDRLLALVQMTRDGLSARGLLEQEFRERHQEFLESLEFFRRVAVAQLNGEKISDEDFEKLRLAPGRLGLVLRPLPGEEGTENQARAAVIADVHTDVASGTILYEATGIPNYLWVAVKDQNGVRLTRGLIFSYYEFRGPLDRRLTDEVWRQWHYQDDRSQVPAMAPWNKSLIR